MSLFHLWTCGVCPAVSLKYIMFTISFPLSHCSITVKFSHMFRSIGTTIILQTIINVSLLVLNVHQIV